MRRLLPALALFLTLIALPANASISLTQSTSVTSTGATTSQTVTLSSAIGAGDLLIVGINWGNTTPTTYSPGTNYTVSDTNGLTWNACPVGPVIQSNSIGCFWAIDSAGHGSTTVTVSVANGGSHTMRLGAYNYASTTGWQGSPVDTQNHNSSATAVQSGDGGPVTPAAAGELIWTVIQFQTAGVTNITGTNGCTERPTSNGGSGTGWSAGSRADVCDVQNSGSTSVTPGFTWLTIGSGYSALSVVFKPAAAAPHRARIRVTQND